MTGAPGGRPDDRAAAEELEVLFPDRALTVRDPDTGAAAALTVREFRFREGLEAQAAGAQLIAALAALVPAAPGAPGPGPAEIDAALGAHADIWLDSVARACGRPAAWLARLGDADARAVSEAMWSANGGFFARRAAAAAAAARTSAAAPCPLPASSTRSCAPATAAATPTSPPV